jgi:putative ABC transport system substrate-binding protein
MRRRDFIKAVAGSAMTWPLVVRAQQAMPVVGVLSAEWPNAVTADRLRAFREGLNDTGYVEGWNVMIEYRWAEGRNDLLPALAAELVRLPVNVIVIAGSTLCETFCTSSTVQGRQMCHSSTFIVRGRAGL